MNMQTTNDQSEAQRMAQLRINDPTEENTVLANNQPESQARTNATSPSPVDKKNSPRKRARSSSQETPDKGSKRLSNISGSNHFGSLADDPKASLGLAPGSPRAEPHVAPVVDGGRVVLEEPLAKPQGEPGDEQEEDGSDVSDEKDEKTEDFCLKGQTLRSSMKDLSVANTQLEFMSTFPKTGDYVSVANVSVVKILGGNFAYMHIHGNGTKRGIDKAIEYMTPLGKKVFSKFTVWRCTEGCARSRKDNAPYGMKIQTAQVNWEEELGPLQNRLDGVAANLVNPENYGGSEVERNIEVMTNWTVVFNNKTTFEKIVRAETRVLNKVMFASARPKMKKGYQEYWTLVDLTDPDTVICKFDSEIGPATDHAGCAKKYHWLRFHLDTMMTVIGGQKEVREGAKELGAHIMTTSTDLCIDVALAAENEDIAAAVGPLKQMMTAYFLQRGCTWSGTIIRMSQAVADMCCKRCGGDEKRCKAPVAEEEAECDKVRKVQGIGKYSRQNKRKATDAAMRQLALDAAANQRYKRFQRNAQPEQLEPLERAQRARPIPNDSSGRQVCGRWWKFGEAVERGKCKKKTCKMDHFVDEVMEQKEEKVEYNPPSPIKRKITKKPWLKATKQKHQQVHNRGGTLKQVEARSYRSLRSLFLTHLYHSLRSTCLARSYRIYDHPVSPARIAHPGGGTRSDNNLTNTYHRTDDSRPRPATPGEAPCQGAVGAAMHLPSYLQNICTERTTKLERQLNSKFTPNIFERGIHPETNQFQRPEITMPDNTGPLKVTTNQDQEADQFKNPEDKALLESIYPLTVTKTFQIFVKNLRGKSIPLEVKPSDTIEAVKQRLQDQDGTLREWQRLMFARQILQDEETVATYNITAGVTLHLMMRLRGGPQKPPETEFELTLLSLNTHGGIHAKIPAILDFCIEEGVDIVVLQEVGIAANPTATCKSKGYSWVQTDGEDKGVAILLATKMNAQGVQSQEIEAGRAIRLTMQVKGVDMAVTGVLQQTGIDGMTVGSEKLRKVMELADRITAYRAQQVEFLLGDMNETDANSCRVRGWAIKKDDIGLGHTLDIYEANGYRDTHGEGGEMTHTQGLEAEGKNTASRIDRVMVKSAGLTRTTETKVRVVGITTDHRAVISRIAVQKVRGEKRRKNKHEKEREKPRVQGRKIEVLQQFAEKLANVLKTHEARWKGMLDDVKQNISQAEEAMDQFTTTTLGIAHRELNKGKKRGKSAKERKLRLKMEQTLKARAQVRMASTSTNMTKRRWKNVNAAVKRTLGKHHQLEHRVEEIQTQLKNKYRQTRTEWRAEKKQNETNRLEAKWKKDPYKTINELLQNGEGGNPTCVVDPITDKMTQEPGRVKEIFREKLKAKIGTAEEQMSDDPDWQTDWVRKNQHLHGSYGKLLKRVTKEEIKRILTKADYSTAAGEDELAIGVLKAAVLHAPVGDETALDIITALAQAAIDAEGKLKVHQVGLVKVLWKTAGERTADAIRPITLLNALGQIPSKVLADRITSELCSRHLLHEANEGFMIAKGTENAIVTMLNTWEFAKENHTSMYTMLFDVSGAYDAIPHETIRRGMRILHLPMPIQNYIMGKLENSICYIKTGHGLTKAFKIMKGVAQGCCLSPIVYIIAMNALHVGMDENPLQGGRRDGYTMISREKDEETQTIGSKGYADDTAALTCTAKGMEDMNEWVNEFCIINRVSMSETKTLYFGRDAEGKEAEKPMEIIRQGIEEGPKETHTVVQRDGATHTRIKVQPVRADSDKIKYLGIHGNMDLTWDKQIAQMNKQVGYLNHLARANGLSAEMTVFLFNNYLKPKLQYRMKFAKIPAEKLRKWDAALTKTVSDKIHEKIRTKSTAIELIMGLQLPSQYYKIQAVVMLERTLNDETQMGKTTRARYGSKKGPENASHRWSKTANSMSIAIRPNMSYGKDLPTELKANTKMRTIHIGGEEWNLPEDHTGTWGHDLEKRTIRIYTDGSVQRTTDRETNIEKVSGGWGLIIEEDWMKRNWKKLHESNLEQYRKNEIMKKGKFWGSRMHKAKNSYRTELSALVKGLMIIPASWDVEWVTDSESSIKTVQSGTKLGTASNENEWQLKQLLARLLAARTGNLEETHQKSHKQLKNKESIGNATADVLADIFTGEESQQADTAELPMGYNNKRWMLQDTKDYTWLTVPVRKKLRKDREKYIEEKWTGSGTQNKVKNEIGNISTLLKRFRKEHSGANMATLTRLVTGVHNQKPHFEGRFKMENDCEFCKQKGTGKHENTAEHEAQCKYNEDRYKNQMLECKEIAQEEATLGHEHIAVERPTEEQIRESNKLMQAIQLKEEDGDIYIMDGESRIRAPTQKILERTTENFVKFTEERHRTGAHLRQTISETFKARGDTTERELSQKTWKMIQGATTSDIQVGRNPENQSEEVPTFHRIGGGAQFQKEGVRLAATITEQDLERYLHEVDILLRSDPKMWSTMITRRTEVTQRTLEREGYRRIATWGLHTRRTMDMHIKIGREGKQQEKQTLVGLEELTNWDDTVRKSIDKQAYITATARAPWPQDQTPTKRRTLIMESMNWIRGTTAARGIETPGQIKHMTERGISVKTARKIVRKCANKMFRAYVEDTREKHDYCQSRLKKEKWEAKKQQVKRMRTEREQAKAAKEQRKMDVQEAKHQKAKKKREEREEKKERKKTQAEETKKQKALMREQKHIGKEEKQAERKKHSVGKEDKRTETRTPAQKQPRNRLQEQKEQIEQKYGEEGKQKETRSKEREERRNERRRRKGETRERERVRNTG
jgi:large subunit ribosomal protein L40e